MTNTISPLFWWFLIILFILPTPRLLTNQLEVNSSTNKLKKRRLRVEILDTAKDLLPTMNLAETDLYSTLIWNPFLWQNGVVEELYWKTCDLANVDVDIEVQTWTKLNIWGLFDWWI